MRLRLLLLLCLATVVIKKVDSSFVNSKWANVFKNFFGQNDAVVAPVEDSPLDEKDARIKRSILASLGAQINCEPGFTGQFCESPICNSRVIPPAIDAAAARLIDVFYLRQSCAGNVTFPLDSESQFLHIQVLTNEGELNGNVTLIDDQGNVVPCTTGCGGGQYNWPNAAPGQYEIKIYVASSNIIYCDVEVSIIQHLRPYMGSTPDGIFKKLTTLIWSLSRWARKKLPKKRLSNLKIFFPKNKYTAPSNLLFNY
uniref:Irg-7 N-terminal galactose binding domain-containing protein n=1 Tax=Acrobeloides nanus TaxID=290746 RepID=A0A914CM22_9BILA